MFRFRWISGRVAVAKFYPAGIEDCRSPDDECHGLPYRRRGASNRAGWKDLHGQEELRLDLQQGQKTFTAKKNFAWTCNKDTKEQAYNDGKVVAIMRITDLKA